jgi:uncharacterized protein YbbC (DUF1343 family)
MTPTGLDRVAADGLKRFRGQRVGLLTHAAATLSRPPFTSARDLFANSPGVKLAALFGPEHGLTGAAQDLIPVAGGGGRVPVHTLYGETFESLKPTPDKLAGLDVFVIDMVDVGSRYYTFQATMLYCLEACAAVGLPVVVLDRPNPLGRAVEGPTIRAGFESFVGAHPIATRHGLTMGELAEFYRADRLIDCDLTVIPAFPGDGGWVIPPSPNMPTVDTAHVYPGGCLIEGTNLSEGRGTTRPFEYVGHPAADPRRVADLLNTQDLPGFAFLPVTFHPTFQKHAKQECGGVFLARFSDDAQPVRMGLALLWAFKQLLGDKFRWRTERYEFVDDKPAVDLLFGSDRERLALDAGTHWRDIAAAWEPEEAAFRARRATYLQGA